MCSIEGFTGPQPFTIEDYTKFNKDRGPDDTNYWSDQYVSFGHNLLAISTNKSKKTQPYVTDKGNVLIYNGEIFGLEDDVFDTEWLANKMLSKDEVSYPLTRFLNDIMNDLVICSLEKC